MTPPTTAGEKAPAPQPLYATAGVPATTRPAGNVSAKVTPATVSGVGLATLKVRVEVPPGAITLGTNVFVSGMEAGLATTAYRTPVPASAL